MLRSDRGACATHPRCGAASSRGRRWSPASPAARGPPGLWTCPRQPCRQARAQKGLAPRRLAIDRGFSCWDRLHVLVRFEWRALHARSWSGHLRPNLLCPREATQPTPTSKVFSPSFLCSPHRSCGWASGHHTTRRTMQRALRSQQPCQHLAAARPGCSSFCGPVRAPIARPRSGHASSSWSSIRAGASTPESAGRASDVGSSSSSAASSRTPQQDVECVASGMDVVCEIRDAADASDSQAAPQQQPSQQQQQQQQQQPDDLAARLLSTALLISPFFFWGTSMCAMKVRGGCCTGSLCAGARCPALELALSN